MKQDKSTKTARSSVAWEPHIKKLLIKAAKDECRKEADLIRLIVTGWLRDKKYV